MLQVRDLMSEGLGVVSPDAHLHDVLKEMNRAGYRQVPVVADQQLVGIITDRDIRLAVNSPILDEDADLSRVAALDEVRVADCMTPDPQCVPADMSIADVADLMSLNKFSAMPVVDKGMLVGMISYIDLLRHYAANP